METGGLSTSDFVTMLFNGFLTLAGILLVFIGFIYSQAATFPSGTAQRVTRRYKIAAKPGTGSIWFSR
jgi:hypothetical protein